MKPAMWVGPRRLDVRIQWTEVIAGGPRFEVFVDEYFSGRKFERRRFSFMSEAFAYAQQQMIEALQRIGVDKL